MSTEPLPPAAAKGTVFAVWAIALVAAILIGVLSDREGDYAWFVLSFGACTVAALCIQLATQEKRGFVRRLAASVTGALVILGIGTGVALLLHP